MFLSEGHGRRLASPEAFRQQTAESAAEPFQSFDYLFFHAAETPVRADAVDAFARVADAMREPDPDGDLPDAVLPPVLTYFGQFVDHDVTVNTDADSEASKIGDSQALLRQPRGLVVANVLNGRIGTAALDSLYGDAPVEGPSTATLKAAMRDGPFLRVGRVVPPAQGPDARPALPKDDGADLPRVRRPDRRRRPRSRAPAGQDEA